MIVAQPSNSTVLREIVSPLAISQIVEWRSHTPLDITVRETDHMFEMALPPFPRGSIASFPKIAPRKLTRFGTMFFRPANVELHVRGSDDFVKMVRCVVSPVQLRDTIERDIDWTDLDPNSCLNLRGELLKTLFLRIHDELLNPGFASATLLESCATTLVIEAARSIIANPAPRENGRLAIWQHKRIAERLAADGAAPSVQELADICGLSPRHLLRLYYNLTGETVFAYIERERCARAKRLLSTTSLPIKVIAASLGFSGASSFSAAFRRATGVTPRSLRRCGGETPNF